MWGKKQEVGGEKTKALRVSIVNERHPAVESSREDGTSGVDGVLCLAFLRERFVARFGVNVAKSLSRKASRRFKVYGAVSSTSPPGFART